MDDFKNSEEKMAQRIQECRKKLNLTQEELGERLGLQKSAIAKYEKGRVTNIKRETIHLMSKLFNVNPTWLMGFDVPAKTDKKEENIFSQLTTEELTKLEKFKNMSTVMFMNEGNDISDKDRETLAIAYAEVLISQRKK